MIRPLLLEAPKPPRQKLPARARAFFTARWPGRSVVGAFAVQLLDALLSLAGLGLPAVLTVPAAVVLWLFLAWLVLSMLRWLSDRLLWRIRTKLIVSYLFIALVPVVLLTLFMAVAGVLLLGLIASRVVTAEVERSGDVLLTAARTALVGLPESDAEAARALGARLQPARELHAGLSFTLVRGGRVVAASGTAPRALPGWLAGASFKGLVPRGRDGSGPDEVLRAVWRGPNAALVVELPVDSSFLAEIERRTTIHVLDLSEMQIEASEQRGGGRVRIGNESRQGVAFEAGGRKLAPKNPSGLMFVALPDRTDWETGETGALAGTPWAIQYDPLLPVSYTHLTLPTIYSV